MSNFSGRKIRAPSLEDKINLAGAEPIPIESLQTADKKVEVTASEEQESKRKNKSLNMGIMR